MEISELIKYTLLVDRGNLLKPKFRKEWKESNYLRGYCYLLSEVFYHFFPQFKDFTPRMMYINDSETHWYLCNEETGEIFDPTTYQYSFPLEYVISTKRAFFKGGIQTERGWISKNGMKLYKIMKNFKHGQN